MACSAATSRATITMPWVRAICSYRQWVVSLWGSRSRRQIFKSLWQMFSLLSCARRWCWGRSRSQIWAMQRCRSLAVRHNWHHKCLRASWRIRPWSPCGAGFYTCFLFILFPTTLWQVVSRRALLFLLRSVSTEKRSIEGWSEWYRSNRKYK